jgi:uncharacterized protein (DUF1499 family)
MKKTLIAVGTFLLVVILSLFAVGRFFYPDNVAETAPDGGAKDLKTRFYKADPATVRKTVQDVIPQLSTYGSGWKIVNDKTGAENVITAEVPVVFFTDDLTVTIKENEDETRVDVRSASRVGKSDFGENARHVRQLLAALDEKLGRN